MRIEFSVNATPVSIDLPPLTRLLDILREQFGLTGSKEGCGEGECGACAVLLDGSLVQACLIPALQLDGAEVVTIEGIGNQAHPDPLQTAFVSAGAVQCGFCTPGMVLAARALLDRNPKPTREEIGRALAGNLCRCTGYGQIVSAVEAAAAEDRTARQAETRKQTLPSLRLEDVLATLEAGRGKMTVVAGATDLMTNLKLGQVVQEPLLSIGPIRDLVGISLEKSEIVIGGATTLDTIANDDLVGRYLPSMAEMARQFAAPAIRNRATIGGNLMSASPAADTPPVLACLDATAVLVGVDGRRRVPIASFFPAYRRTVARTNELLLEVRIPLPNSGLRQAFYKVGTRRAQAIAKVSLAGAARLRLDGVVESVRLAAGSVAPTPIRLRAAEASLTGGRLDDSRIEKAREIATGEVSPIDDVRSTAAYRRSILGRLVSRFLREVASGCSFSQKNDSAPETR